MAIELDIGHERRRVEFALRKHLVNAGATDAGALAEALSGVVTEALFETAAVSRRHSAEAGVIAGRTLLQNWTD